MESATGSILFILFYILGTSAEKASTTLGKTVCLSVEGLEKKLRERLLVHGRAT